MEHILNAMFRKLFTPYLAKLSSLQKFDDSFSKNEISGVPKFGWVWMSLLTHNWQREVVHADKDYRDFLLNNRQKLDDAFVILMGDHGLRFGEVNSFFEINQYE